MLWLFVAVCSYVLLATTALIDKFLLSGKLSDPRLYAFYVGILSSGAFLLLPFGIWENPGRWLLLIGISAGLAQIYGSYFYLLALKNFEASRVVPVIGSLVPIFGFLLTAAVSGGNAILSLHELAGFFFLICGSIIILGGRVSIKTSDLFLIAPAALLFALSVVLAKLVYLRLDFLTGFLMVACGAVLAALSFLFSKDVRHIVFGRKRIKKNSRPNFLFFAGQGLGGLAFLSQSWAVWLAPQADVPVINALAGIQYVFLFLFSLALAHFFPRTLKEKINQKIILQKTAAIVLIIVGLAIFALN